MKITAPFTLVLTLLLTSCGLLPLSEEEQAYKDDCQTVQANFAEYIKIQDAFDNADYNDPEFEWRFGSGSGLITITGQSARDVAYSAIQSKFPWILSITQSYFENTTRKEFLKRDANLWSNDIDWLIYEAFFKEMAKGTSFDITIDSLKKIDDSSYDLELDKVLASFAPSDRFKNCDDALGLKDEESFDSLSSEYGIYGNSGVHLATVSEAAIALWGCKKFGVGYIDYGRGWQTCAPKDYVYDASKYPTSNEPTEEEIAILEERRQDAEREAQNPPSSSTKSNVKPLQGCSSLGSVVQTDDYGQLTCKLVLMNRIRALVWMRS